ncbi:hypothetical protein GCM10010343_33170 [Streptomyces avidinii]|uniref:Isocitrase n=1 Tax=Streptomyces avidinii TaxID=1895 RepID=A0ABS4LGI6_STRAV|nr:hypothetical protein [Streptomyces avidinii]GGZ04540.1 hypothetical protein GCM10010343_33170 [Streptomyces avidinii]
MTGERTAEGFYRVQNGMAPVIARGLAYAPYADLIWAETGTPDLEQAREFAEAIHAQYPDRMLAYNCSPSFNWKAALDDDQIAKFRRELSAMGYRFQFITLAGFHSLNHGMFDLARGYAEHGMTAYVDLQEREFAAQAQGFTAVKHQREVGTGCRVEITGPPDRRMAVNALNSGARVWMADLEDATSPTWDDVIGGQLTLLDVIERRIDFTSPESKVYRLGPELATIMVRPRGRHLLEEHLEIDGRPVSASLVDFGLYFFHCARPQIDAATARTSTSPSWRTGTRHACGTTSSFLPRNCSAYRAAPSGRPFSSRRSPPRSRWRRSAWCSAVPTPWAR